MSDVLSQSEIDQMINALTAGEIDIAGIRNGAGRDNVKVYDFTRPSKFSKEQLRTLEVIFESYARLVGNYLSAHLRKLVTVEVAGSEALTYQEFTNSLSTPLILSSVDFSPLNGDIIIELGADIGYGIIDRVLGGTGATVEKMRDFTEIENIIMERIFVKLIGLLVEPWSNVLDIKPKLNKLETNSQVVQMVSPNEMVALITLKVAIGELKGLMNICIPHLVIKPILDKINTRYWFASKEHTTGPSHSKEIGNIVKNTDMPINVVLGKATITIQEFLGLQQGDVIKLDSRADSELDVYVANKLKFKCIPGSHRNTAAIKITTKVDREDE